LGNKRGFLGRFNQLQFSGRVQFIRR